MDERRRSGRSLYHGPRDSPRAMSALAPRPAPFPGLRRVAVAILVGLALLAAPRPAKAAATRLTAQQTYELGERFAKRGVYTKALEQFNRVRTYFRDDPYALKAELAIADLHYKKSEWDEARLAYEDFLRAHPRYIDLDLVVYRLGMTLYEKSPAVAAKDQTWTKQAVNTWAGFTSRFPTSTHTADVQKFMGKASNRLGRKEILIARFYDRREAGPAVEGRTSRFLANYPDSPDRPEAMRLLAVAYAREDKDPTVAIEALKAADPKAVGAAERAVKRAAARHARQVAADKAQAERQVKH